MQRAGSLFRPAVERASGVPATAGVLVFFPRGELFPESSKHNASAHECRFPAGRQRRYAGLHGSAIACLP